VIIGAGMGGLMTALALRQSGVFASVDIYEQTKVPSTAGAGLNIPPNGARLCRWLGVDLDGGDPKGPDGAIDGGRAAILESTRQFNADGSVTKRPFDHVTTAGDGAGFHHMHRLDELPYKRLGPWDSHQVDIVSIRTQMMSSACQNSEKQCRRRTTTCWNVHDSHRLNSSCHPVAPVQQAVRCSTTETIAASGPKHLRLLSDTALAGNIHFCDAI
jgi:hypothetical protein